MSKLVINSFEDFEKYVGQPLGESEYLQVDQERINLFADATLDHQWIHTDVERAQKESPFKNTIVHGYLTLSLLPYLWNQIIEVNNLKMMINYGIRPSRPQRTKPAPEHKTRILGQPARCRQGRNQIHDGHQRDRKESIGGHGYLYLLFQLITQG